MKNVVGITGYLGSGKTSTAKILRQMFPGGFEIRHLADRLKEEASEFYGITKDIFYSHTKKDKPLSMAVMPADTISKSICDNVGANGYFTPRDLLVAFGAFRRFYHPTYWLDHVIGRHDGEKILLVPDIRYRNEYEYLKSNGGRLIRVVRTDVKRTRDDASETEQENFAADYTVISEPGLDKLEAEIVTQHLAVKLMKGIK